jgi:hypothetical protein
MGEKDEHIATGRALSTTPSLSWELATTMKMVVESMEMAPGAIPHPGRVPEQRLLSPEIGLRWRRRCGTFCGWMPIFLGFSRRGEYIGRRAMSEGARGAHTTRWRDQRGGAPPYGVASPWLSFVSDLDSVFVSEKIGGFPFVSSNSENISCITFLKYKNSRK